MPKDTKNSNYYQIPGGFLSLYDVVFYDDNLDKAETIIYCHIIRRAQQAGYCFEKLSKIAEATRFSLRYCEDITRSLKEKNYIRTEGRGSSWRIYPLKLYDGYVQGILEDKPSPLYVLKDKKG